MAPHRFAVVVVLVCVGVMLLSACGIGMSTYHPPPAVSPVEVTLVVPVTGQTIGSAVIGGASIYDLRAELTLLQPVCGESVFHLSGSTTTTNPPWLFLHSPEQKRAVELAGKLAHPSHKLDADLFPLQATLTMTPACGLRTVQKIEVHRSVAGKLIN